jgi:hypothetical protein
MAECPDKRNCRPLAVLPMVEGFFCIGAMAEATDHVWAKVNDLQMCMRQGRSIDRWHLNENDILSFFDLLVRALEARSEELKNAVHSEGAEGDSRQGH